MEAENLTIKGRESEHKSFEDEKVLSETKETNRTCSSSGSRGKMLWRKVKYQLVEYHSLPGYLKDNEYILRHYRADWPLKQALLSIFTIHNETLNVWTNEIASTVSLWFFFWLIEMLMFPTLFQRLLIFKLSNGFQTF